MLEQYKPPLIYESPDFRNVQETGKNREILPHTRESAWMLTAVAFGATIDREQGIVEFKGKRNREFIQSDQAREKLEQTLQTPGIRVEDKTGERLVFKPEQETVDAIGDINKDNWAEVIQEQHPWALDDEDNRWGLIEGLFDVKGGVHFKKENHKYIAIFFNTPSSTNQRTTVELLIKNGVINPRIYYQQEKPKLVRLQRFSDTLQIANHISSIIEEKEQQLIKIRDIAESDPPIKLALNRRDELLRFVQDELERFERGEIETLSSIEELAETFGYSPKTIGTMLYNHGIGSDRSRMSPGANALDRSVKEKLERESREELVHSENLAWLLGVLSSSHYTNNEDISGIGTTTQHNSLAIQIRLIGERVFGVNAFTKTKKTNDGTQQYEVFFFSTRIGTLIGDVRASSYAQTIMDKHTWIFHDPQYAKGLLNGIFEKKGNASANTNRIEFSTTSIEERDLIMHMLNKLGVDHAFYTPNNRQEDKTGRVIINNYKDIKSLSELIRSNIPRKEKQLARRRDFPDTEYGYTKPSRSIEKPDSDEEVIQEGLQLVKQFGTFPTPGIIEELWKNKETRFSHGVYSRRIGIGSFVKAREKLEKLAMEQNLIDSDNQKQARFQRQNRPSSSEEVIQEAIKLIEAYDTIPGAHVVDQLRKEGKTKFGSGVYRNLFGNGKMPKARDELMRIYHERESTDEQLDNTAGQIYP